MSGAAETVSVIMPTYNRLDMIGTAIDSVLAQTYPGIELVIADDASTDHTREWVCSRYAEYMNASAERKIVYLMSDYVGIPGVRNLAAKHASGSFVAFLDSDDTWDADKLTVQMRYMKEHPECDIVFCGYENILKNGIRPETGQSRLFSEEYQMYLASSLLKKELFTRYGFFDTDIQNGQDDYEWVCRLKMLGVDMDHYIGRTLYYRTIHESNISLENNAGSVESKKNVWMKAIRNAAKIRKESAI